MDRKNHNEFFLFASVGAVGFSIEAVILSILVGQGLDVYLSRVISFPVALTVTWYLNRRHTFLCEKKNRFRTLRSEYIAYFIIQIVGALLNLSVFSLVVYLSSELKLIPVVPLAIGAGVSMIFNFLASKYFVFGK